VFQLQLKAEVGAYVGSARADMFYGWCEVGLKLFHIVSDNESSTLNMIGLTLEMPAPQCTRTPPRLRSALEL
jgi:hypothetical protein